MCFRAPVDKIVLFHLNVILLTQMRNFFDSITKNEMERSETYRSILEQEAARERQVSTRSNLTRTFVHKNSIATALNTFTLFRLAGVRFSER